MSAIKNGERVTAIIRDAGGQIVGRTKLQKIAYLLELTGQGSGFEFEYRHYGPYSEELSEAIQIADIFGMIEEEERTANWGGRYSIYRTSDAANQSNTDRAKFVEAMSAISSVVLELVATAAYLRDVEHVTDAWEETARRKPDKAGDSRLEEAKRAYNTLQQLKTPKPLPQIVQAT